MTLLISFHQDKSLNQSPILDELWIPKCMMEQSNEKMEKNEALGWKPRMWQSRVKTKVWECLLSVIERQEGQCKSTKASSEIQKARP